MEFVCINWLWRPNLPDEGDNHVMELAINGRAECIVTYNKRHFEKALFAPDNLVIETPPELLKRL